MSNTDIQRIFRGIPGLFLVLKPDRDFTIVAASDEYLRATHTDHAGFTPISENFSALLQEKGTNRDPHPVGQ